VQKKKLWCCWLNESRAGQVNQNITCLRVIVTEGQSLMKRWSIKIIKQDQYRSQWSRGLRRGSAAPRLLGFWVRILPGTWMFVCGECCVLLGRGLCDELITHPEKSYRLVRRCVWSTSVGTLIVATIYLQPIQNRYMFRSFTVLQCSHQHSVQPVASDVEFVGYL